MKRKNHARPKTRPRKPAAPASENCGEPASAPPLSPGRRRWFRLAAALAAPLLLFIFLETTLRLAGYGYATRFFVRNALTGPNFLVENQRFGWRFFPRSLTRYPRPLSLTEKKAPGAIRIFVLGESAALGDPDPAFGFSRILQVLLSARHPGVNFEVINTGVVAINSHVIREIARDCAPLGGDFWLVYMGNNEPTGPFGADPVYTRHTLPLPLLHANLAFKSTRTGQLLARLLAAWDGSRSAPQSWEGMQSHGRYQFRQNDAPMKTVYSHFENNVADILQTGTASGARVIVSSIVSNLRDSPPFGSLHKAGLGDLARAEWDKFYGMGAAAEESGLYSDAIAKYDRAEKIDDTFADLQFRLARCNLALHHNADARKRYELARDMDTLRFRADSQINQILRAQSARRADQGVQFIDAAVEFANQTADGIPGNDWLYEHVHLRFDGNYLLARLFADQVERALPPEISARSPSAGGWLPRDGCASRLGYTAYSLYGAIQTIWQRKQEPPFTGQLGHEAGMKQIEQEIAQLRPATKSSGIRRDSELCRRAVADAPNDWTLHNLYAYLLASAGENRQAAEEWRRVVELLPHFAPAYCDLGKLEEAGGRSDAASALYLTALRANPDHIEANYLLGSILLRQGRGREAARHFRAVLQADPAHIEAQKKLQEALRLKL
jgi:tetratricopeptide (TPR) repeat protein